MILLSLFGINWGLGVCLQISILHFLRKKKPGLLPTPWWRSSGADGIRFLKYLASGSYREMEDAAFSLKCRVYLGCLATLLLTLILMAIIIGVRS